MQTRDYILTYINGKPYKIKGKNAFIPLSDFLRYELQQVGTKVVCAEGDCGSCTVVQGYQNVNQLDYKIINSCIKYMYQLDCSHIITIEGLKYDGNLNPVQESMVKNHGAQCGYCTPGFVVAMTALLQKNGNPDETNFKEELTGNLCRCTGYEPIIKAGNEVDSKNLRKFERLYPSDNIIDEFNKVSNLSILIEDENKKFFNPVTIKDSIEFKNENEKNVIVSGGTDIGVQLNKKVRTAEVIMSITSISELSKIEKGSDFLVVGSGVTLTELKNHIENIYPEFYNLLKVFGSPQIRNAGTIGGNIANASPIGDTLPFLFIMDAEIELTGINGKRRVNINNFYKGYKVFDLNRDEIITKVYIPLVKPDYKVKLYKVSKRKDLDIATFSAAFLYKVNDGKFEDVNISYGGVAPVVLRLPETEKFLKGKNINLSIFKEAGKIAAGEISPISDVRASKEFRAQLAENIMMKLYFECFEEEKVLCP